MGAIGSFATVSDQLTTPDIVNETIATGGIEQPFTFPTGTKFFELANRSIYDITYSYTIGTSATIFRTLHPNDIKCVSRIDPTATITLRFQSVTAGGILEIESWT